MTRAKTLLVYAIFALGFGCGKASPSHLAVLNGAPDLDSHPSSVGILIVDASVQPNDISLCTGAFIRDDLVLTAGHCFLYEPNVTAFVFDHQTPTADGNDLYFNGQRTHIPAIPTYQDLAATTLPRSTAFKTLESLGHFFYSHDVSLAQFPRHTAVNVAKLAASAPPTHSLVTVLGYGVSDLAGGGAPIMTRISGTNYTVAMQRRPGANDPDELSLLRVDGVADGASLPHNALPGAGDSGSSLYDDAGHIVGVLSGAGKNLMPGVDYSSYFANVNTPEVAAFLAAGLSR